MNSIIIGISSGLAVIILFSILRHFDKKIIYGLILSGIGFLYVGFAWTDLSALFTNGAQAIIFIFIAYYGSKNNINILVAGYFLHGIWDVIYHTFQNPDLLPPQYDLFCLSIDFTMGFYLLVISRLAGRKKNVP
jgi:hypothetical protein